MAKTHSPSAFTVIVTFICLSLVGLALIPQLSVRLTPSRSLPSLTVSFRMPGNSARVIEQQVTSRLEGMLSRIEGVQEISSSSDNGSGYITLKLDKHADIDAARFEASTLVRQAWSQFPDEAGYPTITRQQPDEEEDQSQAFMTYTLNAPANAFMIQQYGEEHVKPVLSQIDGVYKVDVYGATGMEWRLTYDARQLEQLGLSVADIATAISQYYGSESLGICQVSDEGNWLRVMLSGASTEGGFDAAAIQIRTGSGAVLPLDKVLTVTHAEAEPTQYFRINGLNSVYVSVYAGDGVNQLQLASAVKDAMAQLRAGLPEGYQAHLTYDETESIHRELNTIYWRTGLTVLILLLFVAVITWNLRHTLLILISLAINLAVAVIFYYAFSIEIQLYSLAGITISLNLVIDNIIVMTDHYRREHNLNVFLSTLAATMTTVGALVIIFFMDDETRLSLQDFAAVVIVNLMVSLFVALFLVPALIDKMGLAVRGNSGRHRRWQRLVKRGAVWFSRGYEWLILRLCRHRVAWTVVLVLIFGLPVSLLPQEWPGHPWYKDDVLPLLEKSLGGTLRLFVDQVSNGTYSDDDDIEPSLYINATLPNGSTLQQMNALMQRMETFLSSHDGIRQFQTSVYNARRGMIRVLFTDEARNSGYPYQLKAEVVSRAISIGGGSWSVYGLADMGFSNEVNETAGSYRIKLSGYNYDELMAWAERTRDLLMQERRIQEVLINSEFSFWRDDYTEFYLQPDKRRMAELGLTAGSLFGALQPLFMHGQAIGSVVYDNRQEYLRLTSRQYSEYDVWALMNSPVSIGGRTFKLSDVATMERTQAPKSIRKENQEYVLCLQYDYVGPSAPGKRLLEKDINIIKAQMPLGYTIENGERQSDPRSKMQYWLLGLVAVIIFFTASILFNSLKQPLAIIFEIPISFIGVFLTFYIWILKFDQGGFASFVLLSGITVNASIYLLTQYNALRREHPSMRPVRAYVKAWNVKVIPIFLTVVSTVLGFIPFMVGTVKEGFWFPLAAGTIGGLLASLVGLFIWLPIWTLPKTVCKG